MISLLIAIFFLTFSIFVHELGHFLVARWRGLAAPRFSIFGIGNPIVSRKWRGVEYCICWLPFGAYVMIPQLADLGDFEGELPPEARNLPPAPASSKILVALAGPVANLLFAFALACVVWYTGVQVPAEFNRTEIGDVEKEITTTAGKTVPGPAAAAGLQTGDVIRSIDGKPVADFQDVISAILLGGGTAPDGRRMATITFERGGATLTREVFPELVGSDGLRNIGIGLRGDPFVDSVLPGSPAEKAGVRAGDHLIAIDGKMLIHRDDLAEHFKRKNQEPSTLTVKRGTETLAISLQPKPETDQGQTRFIIGITIKWHLTLETVHKNPLAQIGDAYRQMYQTFVSLINRNSDSGVRHMSGVFGIVDGLEQATAVGLIQAFVLLIVINVSLATFNLLPIPVLDGGHIAMAVIAKLRGRPINSNWTMNAVKICFLLLIGLILYVSYFDIRRFVRNKAEDKAQTSAPAKATPPATAPAKP